MLQEVVLEIGIVDTTGEEGLVEVCKGLSYSSHRVDYLGGRGVADFDDCALSLSRLDPSCQVARGDLRVDIPADACCYPDLREFVVLQLLLCGCTLAVSAGVSRGSMLSGGADPSRAQRDLLRGFAY